ncbi:hypothetical protein [Rossellomorea marisflavi]|uniref:hypothetical protein n=1 Tax=Rossellomorea marisflavi TaxID=189381 RepID=UPI003459EA57
MIWLIACVFFSIVVFEEGVNFLLRRKVFGRTRVDSGRHKQVLEGFSAVFRLKRQKKKTKASA